MSIDQNQMPAPTPFPESPGQQFPPAAFPPAAPPKKKGGKGKWIIGGIIIAAAIGGTQAAKSDPTTSSPSSSSKVVAAAASTYRVTYKITGTARTVDITMQTGNGGTSQQSDLALPVMNKNGEEGLSFTASKGSFAYISAQNQGESGSVTCTIELDGVPVVTNTSSGAYVIATCSGRV